MTIKGFCAFFDVCHSVFDRLTRNHFCIRNMGINIPQFDLKMRSHSSEAKICTLETFHTG